MRKAKFIITMKGGNGTAKITPTTLYESPNYNIGENRARVKGCIGMDPEFLNELGVIPMLPYCDTKAREIYLKARDYLIANYKEFSKKNPCIHLTFTVYIQNDKGEKFNNSGLYGEYVKGRLTRSSYK